MLQVDLKTLELHNLTISNGDLRVRPAFNTHYQVGDGYQIAFAFSAISPQTNEVSHYIFKRSSSTGLTTINLTNEEYQIQTSLDIGHLAPNAVITYAIQNNALLITSPHMANAVYGLIGGGIELAASVDSVNEINTSTLPAIPNGLCCTFGDRICIAVGNDIFFNDPGVEIRSFTGVNVVALSGGVYSMFEGPGGALIFITPNGTYGLPADALQYGQEVFGNLNKVSTYSANQYRNAVYASSNLWGLTQQNLEVITQGKTIDLTSFNRNRYYSKYVGPGPLGTYQLGSIWPTKNGIILSIEKNLCLLDSDNFKPRWYYNDTEDLTLVGMCSSVEGIDLYVFKDSIRELIGNRLETNAEIKGIAVGNIPSDPAASPVVRSITTESDNVGFAQVSYIDGRATTKTTPITHSNNNVIGTSVWSVSENYSCKMIRSRKHFHSSRTDDWSIEAGAECPLSFLGIIDIDTFGKSPMRK